MIRYKLEYENGLIRFVYSRDNLLNLKININQEGLRSICVF